GVGCLAGLAAGQTLALLAPVDGPVGPALIGWIPLSWGLPAARLVFDIAGVVTVGLTLLPLLLREARPREAAVALGAAHRRTVVAGAVWAGSAAALLWLQVAAATGESPLDVRTGRVADYLGAAVAGRALVVAALCGLAVAATGAVAGPRPARISAGLPVVPAVLGMLALPVTGHAATASLHELAVIAVAVHVTAAAGWVGGLGAVLWLAAPRRELLAATLPRYSRLATACLIAVAATGVLGAVLRLPSAAALFGTPYGWMLLGKGLGVVTLALLGARARARILPAVMARRTVRLTAWLTVELAVMGAVIGLAAVLAGSVAPQT
ncbi:MAG: copper resistance D family protein, partial [Pseudonocardiaceae bacterium]